MGYIGKVQDTAGNTHLVGSTLFGTCATDEDTAAKVVVCPDFVELVNGVTIHVAFENANGSGSPTLNVNGTGAIPIYGYSGDLITDDGWLECSVVSFTYVDENPLNGNPAWMLNSPFTRGNDTKVTQTVTTMNGDYPLLLKNTTGTSSSITDTTRFASAIKGNPSTGNISATKFNNYVLGAACAKGVDTSISSGSTSTNLPTSAAVVKYIGEVAGALVYKGTVSSASGMANFKKGWFWIASSSFTIGSGTSVDVVEPGDMLIANADGTSATAANIDVIQTNIETLTTTEITDIWNNSVAVS